MTFTGFFLVDKPAGWTSHDVVARIRALAQQRKAGHAGTLDPMATGLLVVGMGRATRLLRFVQGAPKEYLATARLGVATDTLDAAGSVLTREPMPVTEGDVRRVLERFVGTVHQVPPMVSALKVGGRRLYELAREGVEVDRDPRQVTIYELELLDFAPSDYPELSFRVRCSAGTYVRTLADDVARALGGRAHLSALRRTANGSLRVDAASSIDRLGDLVAADRLDEALIAPASALRDLAAATVDDDAARAVRHGMAFPRGALGASLPERGVVRLLDPLGDLIAVYRIDGGQVKPEVVLA